MERCEGKLNEKEIEKEIEIQTKESTLYSAKKEKWQNDSHTST